MDSLPFPKGVKPVGTQRRYLYFVPEGILITDDKKQPIDAQVINHHSRQAGVQESPVYPTLPLELMLLSLTSHPYGRDFLKL
jgi:hypothetical protein